MDLKGMDWKGPTEHIADEIIELLWIAGAPGNMRRQIEAAINRGLAKYQKARTAAKKAANARAPGDNSGSSAPGEP